MNRGRTCVMVATAPHRRTPTRNRSATGPASTPTAAVARRRRASRTPRLTERLPPPATNREGESDRRPRSGSGRGAPAADRVGDIRAAALRARDRRQSTAQTCPELVHRVPIAARDRVDRFIAHLGNLLKGHPLEHLQMNDLALLG